VSRRALIFTVIGLALIAGVLSVQNNRTEEPELPARTLARPPSVVVLPFKNFSDDPQQDYFSDGLTDDLITDLSRVGSLRVIAPQSSYHYKHNPAELDDIARLLDVLYIVEGSIQKSGEHVRVNVQLTDTEKGESVWAKRFAADTNDIFRVQDDISREVMDAMYITLSGAATAHLETHATKNFEAYDAFLVGQQHIKNRSRQGYEQAMNAYRRAIEMDPDYARAYGAMAVTLTRGYRYQWTNLSLVEARERALELAQKAVALDQSSPQVYWALGYVHLHRREFDAAEAAAQKSVALSPNYADGYALLANIANWRGKANDAVKYINRAIALNPLYTFHYPSTLGLAYYMLGRTESAITALLESLEHNPSALNPRLFLAASYARLDRREEANWQIRHINVDRPDVTLPSLGTTLPFEDQRLMLPLLEDLRKAGLSE
jgi:adenylate cyclase